MCGNSDCPARPPPPPSLQDYTFRSRSLFSHVARLPPWLEFRPHPAVVDPLRSRCLIIHKPCKPQHKQVARALETRRGEVAGRGTQREALPPLANEEGGAARRPFWPPPYLMPACQADYGALSSTPLPLPCPGLPCWPAP